MPKRFEPCLTVLDVTPDGCAELVLDVNGHEIDRTVLVTGVVNPYFSPGLLRRAVFPGIKELVTDLYALWRRQPCEHTVYSHRLPL